MEYTKEDTKNLKASAIFLMLYHHLFTFPKRIKYTYIPLYYIGNIPSSQLFGTFGKLCVAIFMFIGGYGTYISSQKNNFSLKRKIFSLYKNYWKVIIFVIPITLIINPSSIKLRLADFILNITGLNITYNDEWWFFTTYLVLTLLSPLIIKILDNHKISLIYWLSFVIALNSLITILYLNVFNINIFINYEKNPIFHNIHMVLSYLPTYILGMIFAKFNILNILKSKTLKTPTTSNILSILSLIVIYILRKSTKHILDYVYAPIFTIAIMIITNTLLKKLKPLFIKIGNNSTNIWLVHTLYCYNWCQKFIFIPKYTILIFMWLLVISYITSILIENVTKLVINIKNKLLLENI